MSKGFYFEEVGHNLSIRICVLNQHLKKKLATEPQVIMSLMSLMVGAPCNKSQTCKVWYS